MSIRNLNYKAIVKILGVIILITGLAMTIPWIYAETTGDMASAHAFRMCAPAEIIIGAAMSFFIRYEKIQFRTREGYIVVAACWVVASAAGAFPYFLSGFTESFPIAMRIAS